MQLQLLSSYVVYGITTAVFAVSLIRKLMIRKFGIEVRETDLEIFFNKVDGYSNAAQKRKK